MALYDWSKTAATNGSADSAINFAEGQNPSTVNDSNRNVMAEITKWREDAYGALTSTGSSNAYEVTINSTISSYTQDLAVAFIANHASTGACTLNVTPSGGSAIGAGNLKSSTGSDLGTDSIVVGQLVLAIYNGTDFLAQNIGHDPVGALAYITSSKSDVLSALGIPSPTTGDADKLQQVNSTEDEYELVTRAEVLTGVATSVTLTDAASIEWSMSDSKDAQVTISANRTLAAPTDTTVGKSGVLQIIQDGVGSHSLTFNSVYKFPNDLALAPSTGANEKTLYRYYVIDASNILLSRLWVEGSNSIGFYKEYDEGTKAAGSTTVRAHGLGRDPADAVVWLKNNDASGDAGYSQNQRLRYGDAGTGLDGNGASAYGIVTATDDTNVTVVIGAQGQSTIDGSTNTLQILDLSKWDLIIRVYE